MAAYSMGFRPIMSDTRPFTGVRRVIESW
jgi:hypothetical protein